MACAICKTRREKRHCPGVQGEICSLCCGEQREETIACPLDCEYLQYAHLHERVRKDLDAVPNRDFPIPESFLDENIDLIVDFQQAIASAALKINAIDNDARGALAGLIRTYQTMSSGLYYESRPANPIAAAIFDAMQERVAEIHKAETERGLRKTRDNEVLGVLMFLQRMEFALNNERKRGRCFLSNIKETVELAHAENPEWGHEPPSLIIS